MELPTYTLTYFYENNLKGPTFTRLTAKNLIIKKRIQLKRRKQTKIVLYTPAKVKEEELLSYTPSYTGICYMLT